MFSRPSFCARLLLACLLISSGVRAAEVRVALIIANSTYVATSKLTNPPADARKMKAALGQAGFGDVTILENLNHRDMDHALQDFGRKADHADVALIYYAGHGVEINNVNYVVPIDAVFAYDRDIDIEAIKLDTILSITENAKRLRIVIVDACRDNPFLAQMKRSNVTRGAISKGMAAIEPTLNSLVVYSARAGTLASDGQVNSPFAEALARRIVEPGREINLIFREVRDDVLATTDGRQEPFTYGSLSSQEFYFIAPVTAGATVAGADLEAESWNLCKTALTRVPCDMHVKTYGVTGRYGALALTRASDFANAPGAGSADAARGGVSAAPVRVGDLGMTVRYEAATKAILVDSVERNAVVSGKLFSGDRITRIDAVAPDAARPPDVQIASSWKAEGRVKLLIRRGDADTVVILRANN